MEEPEELFGQDADCEQSVPDLCRTEFWNGRSLWQSDLDYFATLGIGALDLANPDMVLKAGIIPDEVGDTFTFEHQRTRAFD